MKYKLPEAIITIYLFNLILFFASIINKDELAASLLALVLLLIGCTSYILKEIHDSSTAIKEIVKDTFDKPSNINEEFANIDNCTIIKNDE